MVKNLPTVLETKEMRVPSLGQEDPLKKEVATHSGILAGEKSHGQRSLAGHSLGGCRVRHD